MGATLATLADLHHLWIKVYIPTDELPWLNWGKSKHQRKWLRAGFSGVVEISSGIHPKIQTKRSAPM